jgi:hypothetical protein
MHPQFVVVPHGAMGFENQVAVGKDGGYGRGDLELD